MRTPLHLDRAAALQFSRTMSDAAGDC